MSPRSSRLRAASFVLSFAALALLGGLWRSTRSLDRPPPPPGGETTARGTLTASGPSVSPVATLPVERGSLLEEPRRTDGTRGAAPCLDGDARTFSLYGDPRTRIIDSIWRLAGCDDGVATPLQHLPFAMRLIETTLVEGRVYALIESVAFRGQPAGLRTWIDLDDGAVTAHDARGDVAAARALLPPIDASSAAVLPLDDGSARPDSARWLSPRGVAIEEVFQQTFRREIGRLAASDRRLGALRKGLASPAYRCRRSAHDESTRGRCWSPVAGFDDVAFEPSPHGRAGAPVVRSVGLAAPEQRLLGAFVAPALSVPAHREIIEAYLARQPLEGKLVAAGALSSYGGSVGIFFSPLPSPRLFAVVVDGPSGALFFDEPIADLSGQGLTRQTEVQAEVLPPPSRGGVGSVLIRFGRPGRLPWAALIAFPHPFRSLKGPWSGSSDLSIDRTKAMDLVGARSLAEMRAVVAAPPVRATRAELTELFSNLGDRAHVLRHASREAVFCRFQWHDPNREVHPIADLDDGMLRILADQAHDRSRGRRPRTEPSELPEGDAVQELFSQTYVTSNAWWTHAGDMHLVREDGRLRIRALVMR